MLSQFKDQDYVNDSCVKGLEELVYPKKKTEVPRSSDTYVSITQYCILCYTVIMISLKLLLQVTKKKNHSFLQFTLYKVFCVLLQEL